MHVPLREPTQEDLLKWPIIDLTSDDPLDPQDLNDQVPPDFRGHSLRNIHTTKLGKVIGSQDKVDLRALVPAVMHSRL